MCTGPLLLIRCCSKGLSCRDCVTPWIAATAIIYWLIKMFLKTIVSPKSGPASLMGSQLPGGGSAGGTLIVP